MPNLLVSQDREALNSQLELQDELEARGRNNGVKWFEPNGKQEEFIQSIGQGDVFVGIFSTGNGVGKTALMACILANIVYGPQNEWFDHPIFKSFPYPHRGRIASTVKNLEEVGAIQTEIKTWWPKGKYNSKKQGKTYDSLYTAGDWVVDVMSYDQDISSYESATLGVCIFDEPPPLSILHATIARMRQGGMILIFMTPLDVGGEIIEEMEEREVIEYDGKEIGKVSITYAEIEDNCLTHGVRGILKHSDILQMLSFYDSDEIEARAKGRPIHLIGRIYKEFQDADPYVVDDFAIPTDWVRVLIIDPHDAIPFAMTWVAIDETGQAWIYDEDPIEPLEKIHMTSLTYPDYARIIREHEARDKIALRLMDPYFGNKRYGNDGLTPKSEMESLGFDFEDGSTDSIETGHIRVREFLKYDKTGNVNALNHPRLHILKRCSNHRRSMARYKRKIERSGEVKDKVVLDQTYKHFCDNIRHLCMRDDLERLATNSGGRRQVRRSRFTGMSA